MPKRAGYICHCVIARYKPLSVGLVYISERHLYIVFIHVNIFYVLIVHVYVLEIHPTFTLLYIYVFIYLI